MKIDESCINHNVALICKEVSGDVYEDYRYEVNNTTGAWLCGYIMGVCELADRLKEVLNA